MSIAPRGFAQKVNSAHKVHILLIKSKFGDCLKNKNFVSQSNELLCKLIAYNITVLINAMYELKIEPNLFCSESIKPAQEVSL